jgi:hypothetical protein
LTDLRLQSPLSGAEKRTTAAHERPSALGPHDRSARCAVRTAASGSGQPHGPHHQILWFVARREKIKSYVKGSTIRPRAPSPPSPLSTVAVGSMRTGRLARRGAHFWPATTLHRGNGSTQRAYDRRRTAGHPHTPGGNATAKLPRAHDRTRKPGHPHEAPHGSNREGRVLNVGLA